MIYLLTYEFEGVTSANGSLSEDRSEIIRFAKEMTQVAIDHLGEYAACADWYDIAGDKVDLGKLIESSDEDDILSLCSQTNDLLLSEQLGHISFHEYDDLFRLIADQGVADWCSQALKTKIRDVRGSYSSLISDLSNEWSGT